jgi:hypothetical protein
MNRRPETRFAAEDGEIAIDRGEFKAASFHPSLHTVYLVIRNDMFLYVLNPVFPV